MESYSQSSMAKFSPEPNNKNLGGSIGYLDVFIHQARDIHNICIYHKQDVYAKLWLTTDPEAAVSTRIINCAGRNPVFNENLHLNVRNIDSSLRCEIWMLSRVKNYLGDQLLGFTLVPLPDVVVANGKTVAQEFSLSSTDLFHSPAGFVHLSLSYIGLLPVMPISPVAKPVIPADVLPDLDNENDDSISTVYEKIEFPDLKVANENQLMVSEYFGIPCTRMDSQCTQSLMTMENDSCPDDDAGVRVVDCLSKEKGIDAVEGLGNETPLSTAPTTAFPGQKDKSPVVTESSAVINPVLSVDVKSEETVVQQEIVDMYMKSMQQFTESLAKMKLPMDSENGYTTSENVNSSSQKKLPLTKESSPRVFYGSRAFF